jgi:hypothetical protein
MRNICDKKTPASLTLLSNYTTYPPRSSSNDTSFERLESFTGRSPIESFERYLPGVDHRIAEGVTGLLLSAAGVSLAGDWGRRWRGGSWTGN